ncbi:hypothetical protein KHA80_07485 [Anaerobacillus sp. HL2]|nr:hypothetical protein KHA80_07485 [Anaerobacillus sp. HL2]
MNKAKYGSKRTVFQEEKENVLYGQLVQAINELYQISDDEFEIVMSDDMFNTELGAEE